MFNFKSSIHIYSIRHFLGKQNFTNKVKIYSEIKIIKFKKMIWSDKNQLPMRLLTQLIVTFTTKVTVQNCLFFYETDKFAIVTHIKSKNANIIDLNLRVIWTSYFGETRKYLRKINCRLCVKCDVWPKSAINVRSLIKS